MKTKSRTNKTITRKRPGARAATRARKSRADPARAEKTQRALYRIADAASAVTDMPKFYAEMHRIVSELMYAPSFYLLLVDHKRQLIAPAYWVDEAGDSPGPPGTLDALHEARRLVSLVIESGKPLHVSQEQIKEMTRRGIVNPSGTLAEDWIAAPLVFDGRIDGVLVLQSYKKGIRYSEQDADLLTFVAQHIAVALTRAHTIEETRQRNAELAIINSVQEGLASKLDMQSIYDLVGDKIQEIFDAQVVMLGTLDQVARLVHYHYILQRGQRLKVDPFPYGGVAEHLIRTHQPMLINQNATERLLELGGRIVEGEEPTKSALFVPLVVGDEVKGAIALQNIDRENAFSESDVRLLQTLANSMSVALENARLFDETQRLLKETEQRNAELAIINSVQQGLASQLDMQAIYDLVGDKIREIFDAQVVMINTYDHASRLMHIRYVHKMGLRIRSEPHPFSGVAEYLIRTHQSLLINQGFAERTRELGIVRVTGVTESPKSGLYVPLIVGNEVKGMISLQNVDRENAFSESDVRLLQTLANSMSVALENARLFDETQRLLKETEQRAAELATINSIGQALAGEIELNALIELVGEKIRETFNAQIVYVALLDRAANTINFPYYYDDGKYVKERTIKFGEGFTSRVLESRQPLLMNRDLARLRAEMGSRARAKPALAYLGVPITVGDQAIGVISIQNTEQEDAFNDDDARLLSTIAANVGIAIDKARLYSEIQSRRQYFESIAQNSPVAIVTVGLDSKIVEWNPAAEKLFGYTRAEAQGRYIDDLVALSDEIRAEAAACSLKAARGELSSYITRRNRRDGSLVDVQMWALPVFVSGERVGAIALYNDIGELQRARQAAEEANQAKSAFLATMSHEIRTPMNAVIGMSNLLLGTPLNEEQREYAEVVRNSGDTLLTIINDILDFSKIEAGKMELESAPFDLRECVEGALDLIATRAAEKGIDLAYVIDETVPAAIISDSTRLRQILLNLLSNAVKFTEQGEVVLSVQTDDGRPKTDVSTSVLRPSSSVLHFSVRDTGIGIPPDRIDRLFQSFSQVDASTSRKYGGTGLGLAISKRLAELMGGAMWAESQPGAGSTFHFTIDARAAPDFVRPTRRLPMGAQPQLLGKRVLIVDDNATNRRILTRQTQLWGMLAQDTPSPREALAWIARGDACDVAILDMDMPELDGVALAIELRQHRDAQQLPLILFSSLGHRNANSDDARFAAYLTKPIKVSALFDALVSVLARDQAAPQAAPAQTQTDPSMATRLPLRILLAEDNAVNQKLALHILSQMGYRADVAGNGIEALQALERQRYDVVLMDVQMPEMDGLEASREIVKRWTRDARPRLVAMTANALQGDREMCLAAGMDDYVSKPIRVDELVAALIKCAPIH